MTADHRLNRRPRWELAAMIALPIIANIVLAVVIFGQIRPTIKSATGTNPDVQVVDGDIPVGISLPKASVTGLLSNVERLTGHSYSCDGPWASGRVLVVWSCRTPSALVVLEGQSPLRVARIDVTWFGFDRTSTDLPAWGAAVQSSVASAAEAEQWVTANVGLNANLSVGGVTLRVGGARGAETLVITAN